MADLNLSQVTTKLNDAFKESTESRILIFWYDAQADFADEIESMELKNAKLWILQEDNQFETKYQLEKVDIESNYLIYAPFAKPSIRQNHLADILYYSKEFFANRSAILASELSLGDEGIQVVDQYKKFFASKERIRTFKQLDKDVSSQASIEVAIMSCVCKLKYVSFEEVVRSVLLDSEQDLMSDLVKYQLEEAFWCEMEQTFGIHQGHHTLEEFVQQLLITNLAKQIEGELPLAWQPFVSMKSGNMVAFLEGFMNHNLYSNRFDELSSRVFAELDGEKVLQALALEDYSRVTIFEEVEKRIISWILERLEQRDFAATLNGQGITELIDFRVKTHFGQQYDTQYQVLKNAYQLLIAVPNIQYLKDTDEIVQQYQESYYHVDRFHRHFYVQFDRLEDSSQFILLREFVEEQYKKNFLDPLIVNWNQVLSTEAEGSKIRLQRNFYRDVILESREQIVVIISDALRYEVGQELFEVLESDEQYTPELQIMQSVLPSYTALGMSALLPHRTLDFSEKYDVLVDGKNLTTTEQRQSQLQQYNSNSIAVQLDEVKRLKRDEMRSIFNGKEVVYLYHNQIDARGDKPASEDEVYQACEEAIQEIRTVMKRIASATGKTNFIITADHGFIYKRDKIDTTEKIMIENLPESQLGKRYILSKQSVTVPGVQSMALGNVLGNQDQRTVSYPLGSDIFQVRGAGNNYVHGGSSPQEMLIPLLKVKIDKVRKETKKAEIVVVSFLNRITNMAPTVDILQRELVSDIVKPAVYRLSFTDEEGKAVSNELTLLADSKEAESIKRMNRLTFTLKNQRFERNKRYYLVARDYDTDEEHFRHEVQFDVAYRDDSGFLQ